MDSSVLDRMDVAVAHLLHLSSIGELPLLLGLAHPTEGPASAAKHLDGVSSQGSHADLVLVVEQQILLLQPTKLVALLSPLRLQSKSQSDPSCVSGMDECLISYNNQDH